MKKLKSAITYFSKAELTLWLCSMLAIITSFIIFGGNGCLTLIASLIGVTSLIAWLRHPYDGNSAEVRIHHIRKSELIFMCISAIAVTIVFYFILSYFNTANIAPSTLSVTTSYVAVYLTFKRSPYYAIGYAANDIVLIILWSIAAVTNIEYVSVIVCFAAFLANDIYGFINWRKIGRRQAKKL